MSDNADMDKVIARIQKLLSRTKEGSGTSEAEADTAMRLAQELLMKHNLDMAVIEAAADNTATAVERVKEESKSRVRFKWQRQLAKYVAEANFCYHLVKADYKQRDGRYEPCMAKGDHREHPNCYRDYGTEEKDVYQVYVRGGWQKSHQHIFVGRKANVITAQLMFAYLTGTIESLVPVEKTQQRFSRSSASWKEGCADRLCERLAQKRKDLIKENDARIKQEEADRKAEAQASYDAKQKGKAKELPANEGAEVDAAIGGLKAQAHRGHAQSIDPDPERPEADGADDWNPADSEEQPPEELGTAMVLASVYDASEQEANYEAAHGMKPGELARHRAEREAREAAWEKEQAEAKAEEETAQIEKPVKEETERQRIARERQEQEQHMKNRRRWAREDQAAENRAWREHQKRDHTAYAAGAKHGDKIGLDLQVGAARDAKKLTGRD